MSESYTKYNGQTAAVEGIGPEQAYTQALDAWNAQAYDRARLFFQHISGTCPDDWKAAFYTFLCDDMHRERLEDYRECPGRTARSFRVALDDIRDLEDGTDKSAATLEACRIYHDVLTRFAGIYREPHARTVYDMSRSDFPDAIERGYDLLVQTLGGLTSIEAHELKARAEHDRENLRKTGEETEQQTERPASGATLDREARLKGKCYLKYKDSAAKKMDNAIFMASGFGLVLVSAIKAFIAVRTQLIYPYMIPELLLLILAGLFFARAYRVGRPVPLDSVLLPHRERYIADTAGEPVPKTLFPPVYVAFGLAAAAVIVCTILAASAYTGRSMLALYVSGILEILVLIRAFTFYVKRPYPRFTERLSVYSGMTFRL